MDNRIGTSPEVRAQILDAYRQLGCPEEEALQLTDTAFAAHNAVEEARARVIATVGEAYLKDDATEEYEGNFLILFTQLEIMHLNHVLQSLQEQMVTIELPEDPTIQ